MLSHQKLLRPNENTRRIWEMEEIPADWREGYLVKLPEKGDLQDCENYREIM